MTPGHIRRKVSPLLSRYVLAVFLVGPASWSGVQTTHAVQSTTTIQGIVVDNTTSQPMAGAQITVARDAPWFSLPAPVMTDAQGRFTLETHETGRIRVIPAKSGFVSYLGPNRAPSQPGVWIQASPGARIEGIELKMERTGVISGRVVGGPPGAVFPTLFQYTYGKDGKHKLRVFPGDTQDPNVITTIGKGGDLNDLGEFRFYDLQPGEYYLGVVVWDRPARVHDGRYLYYPGLTTDETKAVPIRVTAGEEARVGSMQMPLFEKDVELKVRVRTPRGPLDGQAQLGNAGVPVRSESESAEKIFWIAPGRYTLQVTQPNPDYVSYYAVLPLDVGNSDSVLDVELKPAAMLTGRILMEEAAGRRVAAASSIRCTLDGISGQRGSDPGLNGCPNIGVIPKAYELDLEGLPQDVYVVSVKSGDRDILTEGMNVIGNMDLEITLGQPGAVVVGTVRTAAGVALPHASVALVPDAPYRATGLRYRSVVTDHKGQFQLHGIAPGSYKIFAWPDLAGAAYRNPAFMKEFEDRGKPLKIDKGSRQTIDVPAF